MCTRRFKDLVSLNAIDETLPAILERISQQVNIRYRTEGKTILVLPDSPYFKTYKVNYVNMSRDSMSSIGVSGEIAAGGGGGGRHQQSVVRSDQLRAIPRIPRWTARLRITSGKCCVRTSKRSCPPARRFRNPQTSGQRVPNPNARPRTNGLLRQNPCRERAEMPLLCLPPLSAQGRLRRPTTRMKLSSMQ